MTKNYYPNSRPILVYTLEGFFYKKYNSVMDFRRENGIFETFAVKINNFNDDCTARCHEWMVYDYVKNYKEKIPPYSRGNSRCVTVIDLKNDKIKFYSSINKCGEKEAISPPTLYRKFKEGKEDFVHYGFRYIISDEPFIPMIKASLFEAGETI